MTDRIVYGLALAACAAGLVVVALAWSDRRRGVPEASRLRHPATPAPVAFSMVHDSTGSRWLVRAPTSLLAPLAVDIVTFRPSGSTGDWTSEPIVEPIVLEPGEEAVLPSVIADPGATHDVVVAWTVRLPEGDVLGSRTITVPPDGTDESSVAPAAPAEPRDSVFGPVYAVVAALLVVAGLVSAWEFVDGSAARGDGDLVGAPTSTAPATSTSLAATPTIAPTIAPTTAAAPTTAVAPTSAPDTTTSATTTTTNTSTTTATTTPTTTPRNTTTSTPTTAATTTTPTTAATTTPGSGDRQVIIRSRIDECRYGTDCLIAGFGLAGDFALTGEYVCEFEDGSRFVFRYAGGGAEDACAAGGDDPSITIEVDGVRSPTVTRETATAG